MRFLAIAFLALSISVSAQTEEAKKLEEMIRDYRYGNLDSLAPIKKYAYALAVDFIKRKRRWLEATTEYKTR